MSLETAVLTRRPDIPPAFYTAIHIRNLFSSLYASNFAFFCQKKKKRGRSRFHTGAKETGVTPRISDSVRDAHGCGLEYIHNIFPSARPTLSLWLVLCVCVYERHDLRPVAPPTSVGQQQQPVYTFLALDYTDWRKKCA